MEMKPNCAFCENDPAVCHDAGVCAITRQPFKLEMKMVNDYRKPKLDITQIQDQLGQFTGTEQWYRSGMNCVLTDGTKFVADSLGAYWLFDDTSLFLRDFHKQDHFAVMRLSHVGDYGFKVERGDGNGEWVPHFNGGYTTFPRELMPFEWYAVFDPDTGFWINLLKSEY